MANTPAVVPEAKWVIFEPFTKRENRTRKEELDKKGKKGILTKAFRSSLFAEDMCEALNLVLERTKVDRTNEKVSF